MPPAKSGESKPLPFGDTMHDLAVLRASEIDLAAFLPAASDQGMKTKQDMSSDDSTSNTSNRSTGDSERDRLVAKSFDYVREGRTAIRMLHRGDVDVQGNRVDKVRSELEEILNGLAGEDNRS